MSAKLATIAHRNELDGLSDRRLLRELAYIDGKWTAEAAASTFPVINPADGSTIAQVAALSAKATSGAIEAASRAFAGWQSQLPQERAAILRKWFELIIEAKDDLALIMTLEQGKPLRESRGEIDYAASFVEWYAEEAKRLNAEGITSHLAGAAMLVQREPVGVVGVVTPWNFPAAMLTRKAAAALTAAPVFRDAAFCAGIGGTWRAGGSTCRRVQRDNRRCGYHRRMHVRRQARACNEHHRFHRNRPPDRGAMCADYEAVGDGAWWPCAAYCV